MLPSALKYKKVQFGKVALIVTFFILEKRVLVHPPTLICATFFKSLAYCVRSTASCSRVSNGLDFVHYYRGLWNGFLWIHKEWRNIPNLIKALLA